VYLIDTSVWIDSLRGTDNAPARCFRSLIDNDAPFGITGVIYQEVLQGARTDKDYIQLRSHLGSLTFYAPLDPRTSFAAAAQLYRHCRQRSITIRSTIDCVIARIAIEHDLTLVHNDRDFGHLQRVVPELKCNAGDGWEAHEA
jgi:predicted nucleic acid-binding protein